MIRLPLAESIARFARPLRNNNDLDALLDQIGDRRIVLLGEASHGTSEFYEWRRRISERLIREKQFSFIAVEGDWPDCYKFNRFIKDLPDGGRNARAVAHALERWPTWMWANEEVVTLITWLHRYNDGLLLQERVGFYGLDVYSLWDSMRVVVDYLDRVDPEAARTARRAYACFDPYHQDVQAYARATALVPTGCEDDALRALLELQTNAAAYREDGREAYFDAEQNALVARNAERYYRAMMHGGPDSWNLRDTHMVDTLARLLDHYGPAAKAIVWEHNTHVGDARATDMARAGLLNVGQLARQQWPDDVYIVGFSSYDGSVIAGQEWGASMELMLVPPAMRGSWEDVLHEAGNRDKLLLLSDLCADAEAAKTRGHRAIGVVYDPEWERAGNYVPTRMLARYDALIHIDHSTGLHPLHMPATISGEPPETYPTGL